MKQQKGKILLGGSDIKTSANVTHKPMPAGAELRDKCACGFDRGIPYHFPAYFLSLIRAMNMARIVNIPTSRMIHPSPVMYMMGAPLKRTIYNRSSIVYNFR
jgi:hypothetical protein